MNILITGANGFIGRALCEIFFRDDTVVGIDVKEPNFGNNNVEWEIANLTDLKKVSYICRKYHFDTIIHCAGIAHQKIGAIDSATYLRVNSEATENLAKAAANSNPSACFIFLSSVSVYGEGPHPRGIAFGFHPDGIGEKDRFHWAGRAGISQNDDGVGEDSECWPSSDYAYSKLDAEKRLIRLYESGILRNLIILRLAPVYDREWSFNLDRRVLAPKRIAFFKFGTGQQKMSALARPNLVELIQFLINRSSKNTGIEIMNVCDSEDYEFNKIIQVFKCSSLHLNRPAITIPLFVVWLATRFAGLLLTSKKKWLHSCYAKLASSLVFDNTRMLETGFKPRHNLFTIFDPQITQIDSD